MRARLYVDESGDHVYPDGEAIEASRYLSLTGIWVSDDVYKEQLLPGLNALKAKHFPAHDVDDPVILVRRQIIDKKGPFGVLKSPSNNERWQQDFLDFLDATPFNIVTVVLDKAAHAARYKFPDPPYHYCMEVVMERYHGCLLRNDATGDIMAESRSGNLDRQLKSFYNKAWRDGTRYVKRADYQAVLTSRELKIKSKDANVAGLQLADLAAAPSKLDILKEHGRPVPVSEFTQAMNDVLSRKYMKAGRKFLK